MSVFRHFAVALQVIRPSDMCAPTITASAKLENSVGSVTSVAEVTEPTVTSATSVTSATEITEPTEFSNFADVPNVNGLPLNQVGSLYFENLINGANTCPMIVRSERAHVSEALSTPVFRPSGQQPHPGTEPHPCSLQ